MEYPGRHSDADAAVTLPNKSFEEGFEEMEKNASNSKWKTGRDNIKIRGTVPIPCTNAEFP